MIWNTRRRKEDKMLERERERECFCFVEEEKKMVFLKEKIAVGRRGPWWRGRMKGTDQMGYIDCSYKDRARGKLEISIKIKDIMPQLSL